MDEALAHLIAVSYEAWTFDNLRPTIARAVWPVGTVFRPPEGPVVHLSPGSPEYRAIVGEMAFWDSFYDSRKKRLGANVKLDDEIRHEVRRLEKELDYAKANYRRACAMACPYFNMRHLVPEGGFKPDTILNPFIPVPDAIRLSEQSPHYKEIVKALNNWGPRILGCESHLKELLENHKPRNAVPPPPRPEDLRLARMFYILERLKGLFEKCRNIQQEIGAISESWHTTKNNFMELENAAKKLRLEIAITEERTGATAVALRGRLAGLMYLIHFERQKLINMEDQNKTLLQKQPDLFREIETPLGEWIYLCDVRGRLGPKVHQKAIQFFDQCITAEPGMWHAYLARGVAQMHIDQYDSALEDLKFVEKKSREYAASQKVLAQIMSVQAYALCKTNKQKNIRDGDRLFSEAKKLDKQSWAVCLVRGWSNLERGNYSAAKADFQTTLQLCKTAPKAEAYEAMALLLASCPNERIRNGEKAIEHAAKACALTKEQDWICLNTLGAAHAEADDFDSAIKWANKALENAPAESREPIRQRIALYEEKKPYRLNNVK